ncbi:unnamed protein product [Parnassius apollo]|uniref:G patch domain-containing protein 4 n=1 Tax=Parnassius apollo TaxID=110799 RepID=A0A8S3WBN8_PARAO|nr:unnamed protein product [Parnassius apollo]
MDFARKQLEKYGWTAGKGLGKYENGISEALKPKLKRSVTGVGHDPASDFTEHWWNDLYNKAAGNLEVEEKNGKIKRIKCKDPSDFVITNNTWKIKKNQKNTSTEQQYSEYFIKKAILSNGESKVENVKEAESDNEETKKDVFKLSDEELFAACEGRTAHKGARHGLKALGKLARIEQQEQLLLNHAKYIGYSHAKTRNKKGSLNENDSQFLDNNSLDNDTTGVKKKKKKHLINIGMEVASVNDNVVKGLNEHTEFGTENSDVTRKNTINDIIGDCDQSVKIIKNKSKRKAIDSETVSSGDIAEIYIQKKKKKKSKKKEDMVVDIIPTEQRELEGNTAKKNKKKKREKQ